MVEYEIKGWSKHLVEDAHEPKELHQTLKLNPDNIINIKSIKDSWSRDEVIKLMSKSFDRGVSRKLFDQTWIETNL